jgi:hypothetical protein
MNQKNSKGNNCHGGKAEEECHGEIINWLNSLPLSKPVKNVERDFSDAGVPFPPFPSPSIIPKIFI